MSGRLDSDMGSIGSCWADLLSGVTKSGRIISDIFVMMKTSSPVRSGAVLLSSLTKELIDDIMQPRIALMDVKGERYD